MRARIAARGLISLSALSALCNRVLEVFGFPIAGEGKNEIKVFFESTFSFFSIVFSIHAKQSVGGGNGGGGFSGLEIDQIAFPASSVLE